MAVDEEPPVSSVKEQEAAQMQVFWKVYPFSSPLLPLSDIDKNDSSSKECSQIWAPWVWTVFRVCWSSLQGMIVISTSLERSWRLPEGRVLSQSRMECGSYNDRLFVSLQGSDMSSSLVMRSKKRQKKPLRAHWLDWTTDLTITSGALYHWAKRA